MTEPLVIAIVGATATGKTALAEAVAGTLGGEVVCADSRQVYAQLEIGTGKPTRAERDALPHHLFDARSLGEPASAGWYAREARETCAAIRGRDRIPVLVGGSGLYLRAARSGLAPTPPQSPEIRERLRRERDAGGIEALHARLRAGDPESAARLEPRDAQRITRALEVLEATGRPLSWWHRQPTGPAVAGEWRIVELVVEPRLLAGRIARRTRRMFDQGLEEEVRALLAAGHGAALRALRAVGYDEAIERIEGRIAREEAEARVDLRTARLAKRQRTWFRHQVEAARLDAAALTPEALLDAAIGALARGRRR